MENVNKVKNQEIDQKKTSPISRLIQLGREKSFITIEDILREFPQPERDIESLDRIFAALIAAEIPYTIEDEEDEEKSSE